jgi:hypothetical protein
VVQILGSPVGGAALAVPIRGSPAPHTMRWRPSTKPRCPAPLRHGARLRIPAPGESCASVLHVLPFHPRGTHVSPGTIKTKAFPLLQSAAARALAMTLMRFHWGIRSMLTPRSPSLRRARRKHLLGRPGVANDACPRACTNRLRSKRYESSSNQAPPSSDIRYRSKQR